MNKNYFKTTAITALALFGIFISTSISAQTVDFKSIDAFFEIADKLSQNQKVKKSEWKKFNNTAAYKKLEMTYGDCKDIQKAMELTFLSKNKALCDSLLAAPYSLSDDDFYLKLLLRNCVSLAKNYDNVKKSRQSYDFEELKAQAIRQFRDFMPVVNDSFLTVPNIYFFFYGPDGYAIGNSIMLDFNDFYRNQQRIGTFAHEIFHAYRFHLNKVKIIYSNALLVVLDRIQDEGIADLINKNGSEYSAKKLTEVGYPIDLERMYLESVANCSDWISRLDSLTLAHLDEEIPYDTYKEQLFKLLKRNAHPVGYHISQLLVKNGLKAKMLDSFYNPIEFVKLYNSIAESEGMHVFSDRFMTYIDELYSKK